MDDKKFRERHVYYEDALRRLSDFPLSMTPTINDLGIPKSMVQTAYKDMKELHFEGTVIDYLCLVSNKYLLSLLEREFEHIDRTVIPKKMVRITGLVYTKFSPTETKMLAFDTLLPKYPIDARNMVRLFFNDCSYFYESAAYQSFKNGFQKYASKHHNQNYIDGVSAYLIAKNFLVCYIDYGMRPRSEDITSNIKWVALRKELEPYFTDFK